MSFQKIISVEFQSGEKESAKIMDINNFWLKD